MLILATVGPCQGFVVPSFANPYTANMRMRMAAMSLTDEASAKSAWLSTLDTSSWGRVVPVVTVDDAKKAWLESLDGPMWGRAASAMTSAVSRATASHAARDATS